MKKVLLIIALIGAVVLTACGSSGGSKGLVINGKAVTLPCSYEELGFKEDYTDDMFSIAADTPISPSSSFFKVFFTSAVAFQNPTADFTTAGECPAVGVSIFAGALNEITFDGVGVYTEHEDAVKALGSPVSQLDGVWTWVKDGYEIRKSYGEEKSLTVTVEGFEDSLLAEMGF